LSNGLVKTGALLDIDDLIFAAVLDQPLHPIRMHGRFMQQCEYGQSQG
jgi:hypothetical protein